MGNYKKNVKQNRDLLLSCSILLFPGFMIVKYYWVLTLISAVTALVIYYMSDLFSWKRKLVEWHERYVIGLLASYFVLGTGSYFLSEFYAKYDVMLLYLWACTAVVFLVEMYLAAEKGRREEAAEL